MRRLRVLRNNYWDLCLLKWVTPMLRNRGASIFLAWIIVCMIFLAVMTLAAVLLTNSLSKQWIRVVDKVVTVQVPNADLKSQINNNITRLGSTLKILKGTPGISKIKIFDEQETLKLLNGWLSQSALKDLNLPRLLEIKLHKTVNVPRLEKQIKSIVPGVSLDDHSRWKKNLALLITMIGDAGWVFLGLILMVCLTTIIFTVVMTIANNKEVISLIHLIGGGSEFVGRICQIYILKATVPAALLGTCIAILTIFFFHQHLQNLFPSLVPEKLSNGGASLIFWDWCLIASTPLIFTIFSLMTVRTSVLILLRKN